jgi:hypothetical protein
MNQIALLDPWSIDDVHVAHSSLGRAGLFSLTTNSHPRPCEQPRQTRIRRSLKNILISLIKMFSFLSCEIKIKIDEVSIFSHDTEVVV